MKTVELTKGYVALVDDEDYEKVLAKGPWHVNVHKFGVRAAKTLRDGDFKKVVYMHQFVLGTQWVDHINHNGLDNQKHNLRPCTRSQNAANQGKKRRFSHSKYKGVRWDADRQSWKSYITVNYKQIYLGRHATEQDAADSYDKAALKYFGEFACVNGSR